jgi:hypothetical protein
MSKKHEIARRIRDLKPGGFFTVTTEADRQRALKDGVSLRNAGVIDFRVTTEPTATKPGSFDVCRVK